MGGELIAEGGLGFVDAGHIFSGIGVALLPPWLLAAEGINGIANNCQSGGSTNSAVTQVSLPRVPRMHPPEIPFNPAVPPIFRGER